MRQNHRAQHTRYALLNLLSSLTRGRRLHELGEVLEVFRVGQYLDPLFHNLHAGLHDVDRGPRVLGDRRSRLEHLAH